MTDNLLREVDEALRADRMNNLWAQYRSAILFFCVALIVATAGSSIWHHYEQKRGGELLVRFTDAQALFESGKLDEAATAYGAIAKDTHGDVADLAHLWQARALISAGKTDAATPILKETSEKGHSLWSDIACLRLAGIDGSQATCLAATAKSPLASERAQWAAAVQWSHGDHDVAIANVEKQLADTSIGNDERTRLTQWLASMKAQKDQK